MGHAARAHISLVKPERIEGGDRLLEMAALVRDEAHWQTILASAETSDARDELERAVGPLLSFRNTRCHAPLCESGLPPIFQPVLIVRHQAWGDPIYVPIEIRLCEECKDEMRVGDALANGMWEQVIAKCDEAGEPTPTRILTQLTFDRFDRLT